MAKIPLYQSKEQLTSVSPEAVRQNPYQAVSQTGKDLQVAGEAIGQAHNVIRQAYDFQQVGTAKLKTLEGMTALETKASQDGDNTGDFSQYDGEFQRIKADTLKGITNPAVKAKFAMDFDLQAAQTKTQISAMFRKNMVNKGLADLGTMNEYYTNEYAKSGGDPSYIEDMGKNIDAYVSKGFIGADDAQKLKVATIRKAQEQSFISDAKTDKELAKKKIAGGAYGFDAKETETALATLVHYKELEDKNTLIDKIDSRYNLVDAIAQGKEDVYNLSPQAQQMVDNDEILSSAVSKAKQSKTGYLTETTEAENYVKVFDEASKATDRDALSSLATSMIYRDKNINSDKLGLVLFYAGQKAKNLNLSQKILEPIGNETTPEQVQALQTDAGINAISRWAKATNVSVKDHSKVIFDYLEKVKAGAKPYEAINLVINNANLRLHTGMTGYPKEGQLVQDAYGNRGMAFPDGTVKPMAVSKPKTEKKAVSFEEL